MGQVGAGPQWGSGGQLRRRKDSRKGPERRKPDLCGGVASGGWGEIAQAIPAQPPKILHLPTPKFFYNTKCQDPLRPQHPVFSKFHLSPVMFFGQTPVLGPTPYAEPSPHLKRYA